MPYVVADGPCKKCGASNTTFRVRHNKVNDKDYLQSTCKKCEAAATKLHQQENRQYWRDLNKSSHLKKVGVLSRIYGRSSEERVALAREKSSRRKSYVTRASFADELTAFVYREATSLRKLRNAVTATKWEIDHTVPFRGKLVSGLHIWSNIRVIPSSENAKKGNRYVPLHD